MASPAKSRWTGIGRGETVLGLFPGLDSTGGIQTSGRLAWHTIREVVTEQRGSSQLFTYRAFDQRTYPNPEDAVATYSRWEAVRTALHSQFRPTKVIVGQIGFLKLLPFFRISGAPIALFLYGVEAWQPPDFVTQLLLKKVSLFITISDYTWQRFIQTHPRFKDSAHRTVHLGLEQPLASVTHCQPPGPVALMLSRLPKGDRYKGHASVIDVWPLVLKRIPDAQLWIAGDGSLRAELEQKAVERRLSESIRFFGWVSDADKQELLANCRCFVMPSRGEGFGLVYLEAMRWGRPCLVSTLDAGREVVNPPEAGLAVDPDDSGAICDALCRLLTMNHAWETWSVNARRRYEQNFTAAHFQRRLRAALLDPVL